MSLPYLITGFLSEQSALNEVFPNGMIPLTKPQAILAELETPEGLKAERVYFLATSGLKSETKDRLAAMMEKMGQGPAKEARFYLDTNPKLPVREFNIRSCGMPLSAFI